MSCRKVPRLYLHRFSVSRSNMGTFSFNFHTQKRFEKYRAIFVAFRVQLEAHQNKNWEKKIYRLFPLRLFSVFFSAHACWVFKQAATLLAGKVTFSEWKRFNKVLHIHARTVTSKRAEKTSNNKKSVERIRNEHLFLCCLCWRTATCLDCRRRYNYCFFPDPLEFIFSAVTHAFQSVVHEWK